MTANRGVLSSMPPPDKAFAPGRFPDDTQGDGVITGTNGDGKVVSTALRCIDPVFADGS